MRLGILTIGLFIMAFSAATVSAETIALKSGEELDATQITPLNKILKVRLQFNKETMSYSWTEVNRKDLTPEQEARYYSSADGNYYSFTTTEVTDKLEYTYYYNGNNAGWRLADANGKTLRYTGSAPDGVYREYYPGDAVKNAQSITGNLRNGPSRTYFPDGSLQSETWFIDDARNGLHRLFDRDGNLVSEEKYIRGKRETAKGVSGAVSPVSQGKPRPPQKKS